jgi:hypothetical protein
MNHYLMQFWVPYTKLYTLSHLFEQPFQAHSQADMNGHLIIEVFLITNKV